jgi:hypothetical protein
MKPLFLFPLAAALGGLFIGENLGFAQTWIATGASAFYWNAVACSADGARLIAGGG